MRMLRGRKERETSLSFYFTSCIIMYMKALYHRGRDLLLQVSSQHSLGEVHYYLQLLIRNPGFGDEKPGCELP